ncbi:MAG: hypothetical protein IT340_19840 [Chloroflexi bacterium]|nr:hypothetical protein [Chloroflexota bacterium]
MPRYEDMTREEQRAANMRLACGFLVGVAVLLALIVVFLVPPFLGWLERQETVVARYTLRWGLLVLVGVGLAIAGWYTKASRGERDE